MSSHKLEYSPVFDDDDDDDHGLQDRAAADPNLREKTTGAVSDPADQATNDPDTTPKRNSSASLKKASFPINPEGFDDKTGHITGHKNNDDLPEHTNPPKGLWELNQKFQLLSERTDPNPHSTEWTGLVATLHRAEGAEYATAETALIDSLSFNPDLQAVADAARKGDVPPELLNRFLHEHPERLPDESLANYGQRLEDEVKSGYMTLQDTPWSAGLENPAWFELTLLQRATDNAHHHLVDNLPFDLKDGIGHPNPHVNQAWLKGFEDSTSQDRRQLNHIAETFEIMHEVIIAYREHGILPERLNPALFTDEATEVTPELAQLGYSPMHNTPIDLRDRPESIARYLQHQMDVHVADHSKINLGEHPADFAMALLKPNLDPKLSAHWERFNPGINAFIDDGPSNYEESHLVPELVSDPTSPTEHFQASYARLMRDALMNRGMADDAYLNRPTALAYSYVRNTMTIDRMTEFANNSLAAMDSGEWQRPALPGYDPAVQWTSPKEENLQALTSLSNNLTDVPALLAHVHETYLSLQSNFDGRDSVQHDSFLAIYRHHPAAADHDADQDADHPQSILLREALTDLEQSRAMLNWCQHDTLLDQMKQAVTSGNVDQTRDRMIEAGVGWDQLWTLGDQAEGRRSMYDPTHRDPQTMLGRAANRLAHADFAITMAYNPARIPDA